MQSNAAIETSRLYHDLHGLSKLRGEVQDGVALKEAAKQFESMFYSMMLKSMREASKAVSPDPMFTSPSMDLFQDMYDKQLSLELGTSPEGALGLADILVGQLSNIPASSVNQRPTLPKQTQFAQPLMNSLDAVTNAQSNSQPNSQVNQLKATAPELDNIVSAEKKLPVINEVTNTLSNEVTEKGIDYSSPAAFVQSLLPYAQKFAKKLNMDPKVLLAQAALETGWGKYVMRTADGISSNNLFGIKADRNWQGEQSKMPTLEFENGQLRQKVEPFKAYQDPAASFADYVDLISSKPRYDKALEVTGVPAQYLKQLQKAGYATDPEYADKIYEIYHSETLNEAVDTAEQQTMRLEP